jgi:hypothetical protein
MIKMPYKMKNVLWEAEGCYISKIFVLESNLQEIHPFLILKAPTFSEFTCFLEYWDYHFTIISKTYGTQTLVGKDAPWRYEREWSTLPNKTYILILKY